MKYFWLIALIAATLTGQEMKLATDLKADEACAYKVLQQLVRSDADGPIRFYAKVSVKKAEHQLELSTYAIGKLKGLKPTGDDSVIRYSVYLKDRYIPTPTPTSGSGSGSGYGTGSAPSERKPTKPTPKPLGLPKDSVRIAKFIDHKPSYKIGTEAFCGTYNWEIVNKGSSFVSNLTPDSDYFIPNASDFDKVIYQKDYAIVQKNKLYGVVSKKGKMLMDVKYSLLQQHPFGLLVLDEGVHYFYNPIAKKQLSKSYKTFDYYAFYYLKQDLIPVGDGTKRGLINNRFEEVVPIKYDSFFLLGKPYARDRMLTGSRDTKAVVIDPITGNEIAQFDEIEKSMIAGFDFHEVRNGSKFGLIDNKGTLILPTEFDDILNNLSTERTKLLGLKQNGKFALYNFTLRKTVTDFKFDNIFYLGYVAGFTIDGKSGILSPEGKQLVAPRFDKIDLSLDGPKTIILNARIGNNVMVFDENGTCIRNCLF